MVTKTGVCQAYALAFKHIMNKLEIPCVFVPSQEMVHGWNLVSIDGNWYHIDLTWDDLSDDQYGRVSNKNALLSDSGIKKTNHYAYDTKGLTANSSFYDSAVWHNSDSEVVSIHGTSYWASGNSIVSSKGDVIFSNLDEKNKGGWYISDNTYLPGMIYTGLAVHNDVLYFNSDEAIYSFNPKKDKEPVKIKIIKGVCGLFTENNTLKYNRCELEEVYDDTTGELLGYYTHFRPNGEIKLSDTRFGCPRYENGKVVVRVYKEDNSPLCIYSSGNTIDVKTVNTSKISKVEFAAEDEQTIFFWNDKMQPLTEKKIYKSK